jgi:hypothetical protein
MIESQGSQGRHPLPASATRCRIEHPGFWPQLPLISIREGPLDDGSGRDLTLIGQASMYFGSRASVHVTLNTLQLALLRNHQNQDLEATYSDQILVDAPRSPQPRDETLSGPTSVKSKPSIGCSGRPCRQSGRRRATIKLLKLARQTIWSTR